MPTNPGISEVLDKNGVVADIEAKRFDGTRTFTLQGDVSGTQTWSGDSSTAMTINASIGSKKVTTDKINDKAVGTGQIADEAVGLTQIAANAMNGTVQDNDSNLATHAAVKTYVDSQISGQGTYLGKHTVAEVNAMQTANLHNGDRVQMSDSGTINLGPGGAGFDVVAGEDLILYKSGSTVQWDTMDGNFKTKQTAVPDPTASGTGLTFIATASQNANGDMSVTKKTVQDGTTSQKGVVQLAGSIGSTVASENNKAASEKAVRDAINDLDGNVTSSDGTNVQVKVTVADGIVSAVNITTDNTENKNNKVTSWSSTTTDTHYPSEKLVKDSLDAKAGRDTDAVEGNIAEFDANGNPVDSGHALSEYKPKQTAVTDPTASGNSYSYIDSISQDANGVITPTKKTVPDASASTDGVGGTKGLMSASDKEKLDGVTAGANKVEASSTNGSIKIDGVDTTVYTHPTSGANVSKGDTIAQTPSFGGTFKALSATVDQQGHTTSLAEHTVTIPNATATPSESGVGGSAGLMSASDKEKLDDLASGEAMKDKDEVIAASLNDLDERMKAVEESVSEENLGERTADSIDVQVLKIGGDEIAPGTATPSAVGSSASVGSSGKYAREDHTHNIAVASGDSEGQVKVAGQNATVNGWSTISGKAGSAIQGVKVNGTALTPDSNKVVDFPAASTSAYGAVQFMTSSEAASLWANAWAAATA